MAGQNSDDAKKQPQRKLGRGLSALLGMPVEINLPGARPGGSAAAQTGSGVPRGTPPSEAPSEPKPKPLAPSVPGGPQAVAPAALVPAVPRGTLVVASTAADAAEGGDSGDPTAAGKSGLTSISVSDIAPNPRQPRQNFSEAAVASLAESIRTAGLMQPIVVRASRSGEARYELIAGERRWRAARLIGLVEIPAIVRDVDDQTAAEFALIENIQREDLNPMERAVALRRLADEFGLTHQELAERVGLERASVSNLLRLTELDAFTADAVREGKLSQGHAKALLSVTVVERRQSLAAAAMAGDWSVRELERRVQAAFQPSKPQQVVPAGIDATPSAHLVDLERRLGEHLGTKVTIQIGRKKGTGALVLQFYSLDQFDGLLDKLGFETKS
jgi:ParB family chromosome partitioning protein